MGLSAMKIFIIIFISLLIAYLSFAAEFQPTVMTLTCPPEIEYHFNDDPLTIPFTISGTPAAVWLVINTNGQAEDIVDVRNGHLGWHYVNKIDTTVYISPRHERDIGETEIIWDGRNQDGNKVEPGTYDYYLWAYDDKSERQLVSDFVTVSSPFRSLTYLYENDENGFPLARPLLMGNQGSLTDNDSIAYKRYGTHYKWVLGSNPYDPSMLQTTICSMYYPRQYMGVEVNGKYERNPDYIGYGSAVFDPDDYNTFYHTSFKLIEKEVLIGPDQFGTGFLNYFTILKWDFITDGEAVLYLDWLGWDEALWENWEHYASTTSCYSDNNYIYVASSTYEDFFEWNKLYCVSFDGEVIFDKMMHDWYFLNEPRIVGQVVNFNCAFKKLYSRGNNRFFLLAPKCCLHQMINTSRLLKDADDETDMVVFENRNGDYFLDTAYMPDIEPAWYCIGFELGSDTMNRDAVCIDSNDFNIIYTSFTGITSFSVSTQDGTGIGYMAFDDDVADNTLDYVDRCGGTVCDSGSNYDGLYVNGPPTQTISYWKDLAQTYYVAFDSAHGVITDEPTAVEKEESPNAFAVEQNTPNPFNPSTTISFTIPENDNVAVDIYNITGQKVKTIVNDNLSAGKHSVVWDASGFSAGVYFYTVKAGEYEKTMKMTLIK